MAADHAPSGIDHLTTVPENFDPDEESPDESDRRARWERE